MFNMSALKLEQGKSGGQRPGENSQVAAIQERQRQEEIARIRREAQLREWAMQRETAEELRRRQRAEQIKQAMKIGALIAGTPLTAPTPAAATPAPTPAPSPSPLDDPYFGSRG